MKRKDFLQSILGASAFIGLSLTACNEKESLQELVNNTKKKVEKREIAFKNPHCWRLKKIKMKMYRNLMIRCQII